ncbi:hypothetical protein PROFUN_10634 [Planoprotostelium fungivorum]|uniref:Uncharacterized protein n=1 Tax=Planoprotostelium fungivorum TaxID=1890364 RepID=A0A2P6ND83_9EUKA|nr:hypothetical protein PROFUN_10634 [Planoprotostelium fungivorum]
MNTSGLGSSQGQFADPLSMSRRTSMSDKFSSLENLPPRVKSTADAVPATLEGLKILIVSITSTSLAIAHVFEQNQGSWRSVVKLVDRLLIDVPHRHDMIQIRLCRIVANMKLRMHKAAQTELLELGDFDSAPNLFEDYPEQYGNLRGSMIPFTLRVLRAVLPLHLKASTSLDPLYELLTLCKTQMDSMTQYEEDIKKRDNRLANLEDSLTPLSSLCPPFHFTSTPIDVTQLVYDDYDVTFSTWNEREKGLTLLIATRMMMDKEYPTAIIMMMELLKKYPEDVTLLCSLGRIYLQLGNIRAATATFKQVESLMEAQGELNRSTTIHMNRGYLALASDQFTTAINHFQHVLDIDPLNVVAANNKSICYLYTCNLAQAITSIEDFILKRPEVNVNETIVSNLCTLYDLKSDNSADRKKSVLSMVAKYAGDDFDFSVIKLNPT